MFTIGVPLAADEAISLMRLVAANQQQGYASQPELKLPRAGHEWPGSLAISRESIAGRLMDQGIES